MTKSTLLWFRLLGLAHIAIATLLLPSVMFLGFFSVVVVTPALVWLAILGFRLWRPNCRLRTLLRHTHRVLLLYSILLVAYGLFALGEAQRSAETGGGLLGGFGLIPIAMGLLAGSLSIVSLLACHSTAFQTIPGTARSVEDDAEPLAPFPRRQVAKKIAKGVELHEEVLGEGPMAEKGAVVAYNARFFLRRGDEVTRDGEMISRAREHLNTRIIDGIELIDHVTELGTRRSLAGVEKSLFGMRKKGYREVLVSPHLAYGAKGVPGLIPPNAMLRIQLWVWNVQNTTYKSLQYNKL